VLHLPASRPLENPTGRVEVMTRDNQPERIDFPRVVEQYGSRQRTP